MTNTQTNTACRRPLQAGNPCLVCIGLTADHKVQGAHLQPRTLRQRMARRLEGAMRRQQSETTGHRRTGGADAQAKEWGSEAACRSAGAGAAATASSKVHRLHRHRGSGHGATPPTSTSRLVLSNPSMLRTPTPSEPE